ncbi:MAG TPA: hypothetical protein H9873_09165 [Candidatus Dorea gallistercoris]|uniref:Uncharacterized protein n=1 Tax=Candidatus Dorea gallistercoris TaxID=2838542 RepID=A0A9D1UE36_9FIRM|nr:hypothetical protein [Candidatus Dorea gallistercoris]
MIIKRDDSKEKRRRKRMRTKYGQASLRHSKKGVKSCFLAGTAVFFLVFLLAVSFLRKGELSALVGFAGIGILALSIAGLVSGVRGLKEREKNYATCKAGIGISIALILGMCGIFVRGLF